MFRPRYTITDRVNNALLAIERARGFLDAANLKEEWLEGKRNPSDGGPAWRDSVLNFGLGQIKGGLPDRAMTRDLSWEPSYHELTIDELKSPDDIRQISYDVGVQLGHGHVSELESLLADQFRYAQYKKLERFGGRVSEVATLMVEEMLEAWEVFREEAARQGLVEPQTPTNN